MSGWILEEVIAMESMMMTVIIVFDGRVGEGMEKMGRRHGRLSLPLCLSFSLTSLSSAPNAVTSP
ncbi:hypothetical protein ACLOJK_023029, partial [Asimina triloba]